MGVVHMSLVSPVYLFRVDIQFEGITCQHRQFAVSAKTRRSAYNKAMKLGQAWAPKVSNWRNMQWVLVTFEGKYDVHV